MSGPDLKDREKNSVYDDEDKPFRRKPEPGALEDDFNAPSAGNENLPDGHPSKTDKQPLDGKELDSAETQTGSDGFWNPETDSDPSRSNRPKNPRGKTKKIIAGGSGGILIVVVIGLLSFLSGPLEFKKLEDALGKFDKTSSTAADSRVHGFTKMARAGSTGDVGETRVGIIGSRIFRGINDRLASEHGISFERRNTSGRPTRILITDPPESSPLRGATPEQTQTNIAKQFGIPIDAVHETGSGGYIDIEGSSQARLRRKVIKGAIDLDTVSSNKVRTSSMLSMRYRVIAKFWNAPSLFHPMQRSGAAAQDKWDVKQQRVAERKRKNRPGKAREMHTKYARARNKLQGKVNGTVLGSAGAALAFTGELCFLSEIAGIIPLLNHGFIVQPAMEEALDKRSIAAQMGSGDDFTHEQLGAVRESFTDDEGHSIWGAKSLDAQANGGPGKGAGADPALQQAFEMRGGNLEVLSNTLFEDVPELQAIAEPGDKFAEIACSVPGYTFQVAAGVGLAIFVPGGAIPKISQAAGSVVLHAIIASWASSYLEDDIKSKAQNACGFSDKGEEEGLKVEDAHKFGNCMAYGARGAHNTTMSSMGGVELSESEELALVTRQQEEGRAEFKKENLATRLFDINEPRSLIGKMALSTTVDPSLNISTILSQPLKIPRLLVSSIISVFSPTAFAEPPSYDWGFPLVSIPPSILENPEYEDNYKNAKEVEALHNSGGLEAYEEKIEECWGVKIKRSGGMLKAIPFKEVSHTQEEYAKANCNDLSDPTWVRIMLFVFDDSIIASADCYEGGDESCKDIGVSTGSGGSSDSAGEVSSDVTIQKYPNPLSPPSSGGSIDPKGITLHWWGGSANGNIDSLANTLRTRGLSVQFGITQNGEVYQMMENETDKASHARGANNTTFGIEIEGGPEDFGLAGIEAYPEKFEAVVALVQYLTDKYNIPTSSIEAICDNVSGVHPHKSYNDCEGAATKPDIDDAYFNAVMEKVR